MKKLLIAGVVLAAGLVIGCSGGSPVGVYELDTDHLNQQMDKMEAEAKNETEKAGIAMGRSLMEGLMSSMEIELKEDGTATISAMGMPTSGTYKLDGNKVTFNMDGGSANGGFSEMTYNGAKGTLTAKSPPGEGPDFEMQFKKKKTE